MTVYSHKEAGLAAGAVANDDEFATELSHSGGIETDVVSSRMEGERCGIAVMGVGREDVVDRKGVQVMVSVSEPEEELARFGEGQLRGGCAAPTACATKTKPPWPRTCTLGDQRNIRDDGRLFVFKFNHSSNRFRRQGSPE